MAIVRSFRVIALCFKVRFRGDAMLLLHLFKLPHNDTKRYQLPTILWLHDNIVPVF